MKKMFILAAAYFLVGGLSSAHAADIEKGKALFESSTLGEGTTGKSCKTCHENGRNLGSDLFERKHLTLMGKEKNSVAEMVNVCIEKPLGGKAIDTDGAEMQDILGYMKKLVIK